MNDWCALRGLFDFMISVLCIMMYVINLVLEPPPSLRKLQFNSGLLDPRMAGSGIVFTKYEVEWAKNLWDISSNVGVRTSGPPCINVINLVNHLCVNPCTIRFKIHHYMYIPRCGVKKLKVANGLIDIEF
jgi:hypothetical protein